MLRICSFWNICNWVLKIKLFCLYEWSYIKNLDEPLVLSLKHIFTCEQICHSLYSPPSSFHCSLPIRPLCATFALLWPICLSVPTLMAGWTNSPYPAELIATASSPSSSPKPTHFVTKKVILDAARQAKPSTFSCPPSPSSSSLLLPAPLPSSIHISRAGMTDLYAEFPDEVSDLVQWKKYFCSPTENTLLLPHRVTLLTFFSCITPVGLRSEHEWGAWCLQLFISNW